MDDYDNNNNHHHHHHYPSIDDILNHQINCTRKRKEPKKYMIEKGGYCTTIKTQSNRLINQSINRSIDRPMNTNGLMILINQYHT